MPQPLSDKISIKRVVLALLALTCLLLSETDAAANPFSFGLRGGRTRITDSANQHFRDSTTLGAMLGLDLLQAEYFTTGLQFEYTKTLINDTVTDSSSATTLKYEEEIKAGFLVIRIGGNVYLKALAGAANRRLTTDDELISDTTRGSYGGAIGFELLSGGSIELEYIEYDTDVTMVTFGFIF